MGVAPPVSDDCAPMGRRLAAFRTIACTSCVDRGATMPAAWPPGKWAASERYFGSIVSVLVPFR
jgi:hypothetical protein